MGILRLCQMLFLTLSISSFGQVWCIIINPEIILFFNLIQFKNEKREQRRFNYESKSEHPNIELLLIVNKFARQTISRVLSLKLIISLGLRSLLSSSNQPWWLAKDGF